MKALNSVATFFIVGLFLIACNSSQQKEGKVNEKENTTVEIEKNFTEEWLAIGDSISNHAQNTLLNNVATAMKEGGPEHAIDFCNTAAVPLTDSIAGMHNVNIQRITDKNRNPDNHLSTLMDSMVWEKIQTTLLEESEEPLHYVEQEEGGLYYYKAIKIGMPTCLACHGGKEDISETTLNVLAQRYPNDKAIAYELGDLRGLWKIKLK